jgi:hypothetical protein
MECTCAAVVANAGYCEAACLAATTGSFDLTMPWFLTILKMASLAAAIYMFLRA